MADSIDIAATKPCPCRENYTQDIQRPSEEDGLNNLVFGLFYLAYEVTLSFHTQAILHCING